MAPLPWLSINSAEDHVTLRDHKPTFSDIPGIDADDEPSLVTFIGGQTKSSSLAGLLAKPKPYKRHGAVFLLHGACKTVDPPAIYADCELNSGEQNLFVTYPKLDDCVSHTVDWFCNNDRSASDFSGYAIANVITPLSSVLCIFADDLGGFPGVASFLASQIVLPVSHSLPMSALPHVLVVVNASSTTYNNDSAAKVLLSQVVEEVVAKKSYNDIADAIRDLESKFRAINVHGFIPKAPPRQRTEELKTRLSSLQKEVYWSRRTGRYLFKAKHFTEFSHRMITKLSTDGTLFNFVQHSRTEHFETGQLFTHLSEILALMPGQHWLWRVIAPLFASAFFTVSYPPESHHFPPETLFNEFFAAPCKQALSLYTRDSDVRARVITSIKTSMEEYFRQLEFDPIGNSALDQHQRCLETLWPHLAVIKSNRSCFSCFMFMPEKVFQCGHAICDVCVRRFGVSSGGKHSFAIPCCRLCGYEQPKDRRVFRLIPPTAGIRTLCIDGGGVRGVIALMFLECFADELSELGGAIYECFDYVCGTSAGGLIALGVFLMQWSPSECLRRFEDLATVTFRAEEQIETRSWSQKVQRLFRICLQDHRYNLSPIERAFHSTLDSSTKVFNPLQADTKVAVTTTSVRANMPGVISNYNGGPRLENNNYHHIRAARTEHDMTISEAAACTSAAPFFFKTKDVVQLDTFQDGGLRHNNPALLATWECGSLWPEKCLIFESDPSTVLIDHTISLGTGTSFTSKYELGPHSPKRDRWFKRLGGNYMCHLDSQEQWNTFIRCVPAKLRPRFHRLNVSLPSPEPALDDVTAINQLKCAASKYIESESTVQVAKNTMFASLFYLEVDNFRKMKNGMYRCSATIHCRLPLGFNERKKFYQTLLRKHALFLVNGQSIPCVQSLPSGFPIFRRGIELLLKSMTDRIQVSITGITSEPTVISGMPTQLGRLAKAQNLLMPFGCIDNRRVEKQLPDVPQKRKAREIS